MDIHFESKTGNLKIVPKDVTERMALTAWLAAWGPARGVVYTDVIMPVYERLTLVKQQSRAKVTNARKKAKK